MLAGSHELIWQSSDVGERYKQLIPPRHPSRKARSSGPAQRGSSGPVRTEKQMQDAVAKASLSSKTKFSSLAGGELLDEVVMFLDLDQAAIFGNDGNDFGIMLQWMDHPHASIVELYHLLLNPNVKETYRAIKARANKVSVVIYTMRASFLLYTSCFRGAVVPVRWNPRWYADKQLYLPIQQASAHEIMAECAWPGELLHDEVVDMRKSLERLLAVRQVLQTELGLDQLPQVVITAQRKCVRKTAAALAGRRGV